MKKPGRIFILIILLLDASYNGYAQSGIQQADTMKLKEGGRQSSGEKLKQNLNVNGEGQISNGNTYRVIKQVRSGRPDMTRSGGARPHVIVRPSGSGIPKGVGKPGGAGGKSGR